MFRKPYVTLAGAITLLFLVVPVYAAPPLSLGSNSSYNLTGRILEIQSCTTAPANYTLQACYGIIPPPPPPPPPTVTILIRDNQFVPANLDVSVGSTIVWINNGTLAHSVVSNDTVSSFNSGSIAPSGNFSYVLKSFGGTFHYYDPLFPWMEGTIVPVGCLIPESCGPSQSVVVPVTVPLQLELSGTIGWNIEGLSGSQANLNVSHQVNISASLLPGLSFTPLTESGSFEQSINLSTRVESPSTATALVESFSSLFLSAFAGTSLETGSSGSIFQNMILSQSNSPYYTTWWVNGPLFLGSPVQILQGWSSVTGSESLNLGSTIGTRSAWIVTSQSSENVNLNIPNPSNHLSSSNSNAIVNLKFLWTYDKSADLLLRNDNTASLTMHSETPSTIYTSTGPVSVTVTRDMSFTIDVALQLSSTNLSLPKSPSHTSTLMNMLSAMPWMPLGIAGLIVGFAVAAVVWFTRRAKGVTIPSSASPPGPLAPPATLS